MELRIPGRVWYDALDPMASGMAAEIGLPQPRSKTKGRGVTVIYDDVTHEQALEVGEYLEERALLLSAQSGLDPNERELYRIMGATGRKVRGTLGKPEGKAGLRPVP